MDTFHTFEYGVPKTLASVWTRKESINSPYFLDDEKVSLIDERIAAMRLPPDKGALRPFSQRGNWKGRLILSCKTQRVPSLTWG